MELVCPGEVFGELVLVAGGAGAANGADEWWTRVLGSLILVHANDSLIVATDTQPQIPVPNEESVAILVNASQFTLQGRQRGVIIATLLGIE